VSGAIDRNARARDVITVGASAGGVQALTQLLAKLPAGLPAIVGVVLHRSPHIESRLPFVLGRRAAIKVVEPASGDLLEQGVAYVPPRDQHLIFQDGRAYLSRGPREHLTRPAIDPLFRSAAAAFGPRVVGVLLTGYGGDGVPGLISIKAAGGISLVQDPREATHPAMPQRAIAEDDVDAVLTLDGIAAAIVNLVEGRPLRGEHDEVPA